MESESSFIARHVRRVLADGRKRAKLVELLNSNEAYVETRFGAVVVVDISGYSTVTSNLSKLGKISSELITTNVNNYLCRIIDLITEYHGDVVKEMLYSLSSPKRSIRKPKLNIDLSSANPATTSASRTSTTDPNSTTTTTSPSSQSIQYYNKLINFRDLFSSTVHKSTGHLDNSADISKSNTAIDHNPLNIAAGTDGDKIHLAIHVALTAGSDTQHVIIGNALERMDYCVYGSALEQLGSVLSAAKPGELGISKYVWETVLKESHISAISVDHRVEGLARILNSEGIRYLQEKVGYQDLTKQWCTRIGVKEDDESDEEEDIFEESQEIENSVTKAEDQCVGGLPDDNDLAMMINVSTPTGETIAIKPPEEDVVTVTTSASKTATTLTTGGVYRKKAMTERFINQSILKKMKAYKQQQQQHQQQQQQQAAFGRRRGSLASSLPPLPAIFKNISKDGDSANLSEFRTVTVMFIHFHSSTFTAEVAQKAFSGFLSILTKWEGVFQQYVVDEKGQTMMACFGLPPWTHTSDPLNALKCAVEFSQLASKQGWDLSTSVATGQLLYTKLGNANRSDASLLGDVVNLAARIMGILHNASRVLCDEATYLATKSHFNHIDIGEYKLKGKMEPVRIIAVQPALPQTIEKKTVIFGYEVERRTIMSSLNSWLSTKSERVFMVEGKSGMGKSTLLASLLNDFTTDKISFCLTQGTEIKQWTSYFAIQSARSRSSLASISLQSLSVVRRNSTKSLRRDSGNDDERREKLWDFLTSVGESTEMVPLLANVLPLVPIEESPFSKNLDGPARCVLIKAMVIRILQQCTQLWPAVLVFDDAQWIDPLSFEIIESIIRSCTNVYVLFFSRPLAENTNSAVRSITKFPGINSLMLNGLSDSEIAAMTIHGFASKGVSSLDPDMLKAVSEKSERKPLNIQMILEVIDARFESIATVEHGILRLKKSKSTEDLLAGSSVQSVILYQFDRLDPALQNILRVASVLGQYFDLEDLIEFLDVDMDIESLEQLISEKDSFHFLQVVPDVHRHSWAFRHHQFMTSIYESLSYAQREGYHQAVAQLFEESMDDLNRDQVLPLVCYHFSHTQNGPKRVQYYEEMGYKAYERCHHRESMEYFGELIAYVEPRMNLINFDNIRLANWQTHLGYFKVMHRQYEKARELFTSAMATVGLPWPESPKKAKLTLVRHLIRLYLLWKRTKGGLLPYRPKYIGPDELDPSSFDFKVHDKPPTTIKNRFGRENVLNSPRVRDIIIKSYHGMFRYGLYTGHLNRDQMALTMLEEASALIIVGYYEPAKWAELCYYCAFGLSWSAVRISDACFRKARFLDKTKDLGVHVHAMHHVAGLIYYVRAQPKTAIPFMKNYIKYYEERGDAHNALMGTSLLLAALFFAGDLHTLDIPAEERALDENTDSIWQLPVMVGLYRRSLMMNNASEIERLYAKIEEILPMKLDKRPMYHCAFEYPRCWMALKNKNHRAALAHYKGIANSFITVDTLMSFVVEVLCEAPILTWLFLCPWSPAYTDRSFRWNDEDLKLMMDACKIMVDKTKHFGVKKKMPTIFWSYVMFEAAYLYLKTRRPEKALKKLVYLMDEDERAAELEQLKLHRATLHWIRGWHSVLESQRKHHGKEQLELFAKYNIWAFEKLFQESTSQLSLEKYHCQSDCLCFRSIHGTLGHLYVGQALWLARMKDEDTSDLMKYFFVEKLYADRDVPQESIHWEIEGETRESLQDKILQNSKELLEYVQSLTKEELESGFGYARGKDQRVEFRCRAEVLLHVFNHSTHHRGQITSACFQLGLKPPSLDLFYMLPKSVTGA
ncbi:hypothetical protein HDV05_004671 [Chytridiales sp. JEL 0842]|nr:hypothetical protein HDV05_004671 [Chytridiales sp. JEL 0842]